MPPVIGAVAAGVIAGSTFTVAAGLTLGFSISSALGALVLGGLSYALTPKPKRPAEVNQISSNTIAVRQSAQPHKHIYGHTRIADAYVHMTVTGGNGKLHSFIVLAASELTSIDEIWAGDYCIPPDHLDAEGNVIAGRYAGNLRIRKHLGSSTQVADPVAVAEIPEWTNEFRGQGRAYLYITATKNQDVFPNGFPNFSAIVKGRKLYDYRDGQTRFTTNAPLFVSDFIHKADFGYEASDSDVDSDNFAAQANIGDEIVTTEALDMTLASVDTATDIITLTGDRLLFQIGDQVEVVAPGSAPGGTATATNYYVIPYQIITTPRIRLAATLKDAMEGNAVNLTSGGSGSIVIRKNGEPRYHGAGIVDTARTLGETLNDLCNSIAGRAVPAGGYWRILAGAWREPELTLGIGDMRGPISFKTAISMSERENVIKGKYITPLSNFKEDDYPIARYQTFIDQDNGQEYPRELNLPFTPRPTTAQRIAKIELFRARQEIIYTIPFSMKAFKLQVGDTVNLTIERVGIEEKPFEVTQMAFTVSGGDNPSLLTRLTLRETAEAIYDWTSGEAIDVDPAPNSNLPDVFTVEAVTGLSFSSRAIDSVDGDVVYSLSLKWNPHQNAFVRENGSFEIQFKRTADDDWQPSFFVDGALTSSPVLTASVNTQYDLRIRARNNLGVRSATWTTILGAVVGSSGGVSVTNDWGSVADAVGTSNDWGSVADPVTVTDDWGYVV